MDARIPISLALLLAQFIAVQPAAAQAGAEAAPTAAPGADAQELAKQLSNPVASLISVPFQENMDFGAGPNDDGFKSVLNIQPVVPLQISANWNLILRTILPIAYESRVADASSHQWGLGDTTQSFFLSPAHPGPSGIVWGIGPVGYYPTATDDRLGTGKWGAGVTALVLKQAGKNTFGVLANQVWSIAGDDHRDGFSTLFLQPFFSHTNKSAMTFGLNAEATYDWKHDQWVIPLNLSVTQLTKLGKQPISFGGGFRYYVEKPENGPEWGFRFIVTLLFPKK